MIAPPLPHVPQELAGTPRAFRRVEIACLLVFPIVAATLLWRLCGAVGGSPALLVIAALAGYLAADLGTGLTHWFFDTWLSPHTPIVGRAFVRTFREHHVDPDAICHHDFVETNGANALAGTLLALCGLCAETESAVGAFTADAIFFLSVFTSMTSQIHKWAHAAPSRVPRAIRWLQLRGVILSRGSHAIHHRAAFDDAYCITSGWLNAPLRRLAFFRVLERIVSAATGARPRREAISDVDASRQSSEV